MRPIHSQTAKTIVAFLFIASGALGLVYQIVWFKYISLFLGNTTYAQTIVLATFMGGLAIGYALLGLLSDRIKNSLGFYALLEFGIGAYCLLFPSYLNFLKEWLISFVTSHDLPSDGSFVLILKLLISIFSLLLPTIMMGGTLPVLVRFFTQSIEESGKNIAILYFLNSFGAVCGSLLAGFFIIRILGLSNTIYISAYLNIIIGIISLVVSKLKIQHISIEHDDSTENTYSHTDVLLAIITAGISGFAAMIYEVSWVRLLIPILGSSTYSFSLMLVVFITGISIGSLITFFLLHNKRNLPSLLGWYQICIAISMLISLPLYSRLPFEFWRVSTVLSQTDSSYPIYLALQFIFCFLIMILPTIFLGMSLPIATRIAARGLSILGKSVGTVFAINTTGTVAGSLLAGLLLIPFIGVKHALEIGIVCNVLAGISIFVFSNSITRQKMILGIIVAITAGTLYIIFSSDWNKASMLTGVFRKMHAGVELPKSFAEFKKKIFYEKILFYKEGSSATVGVVENSRGNEVQQLLIVNGKTDASSIGDLPTQILCGQIPCMIHKNPKNVLVVGLGSGVSVGSILTHNVERVDCIELLPEVVEASVHFNHVNNQPLSDPRTQLFIDDALSYVKLTPMKYDILVNVPTNPWIAGVGNLFTVEFYEACKKIMNDDGIMLQWFHLYEMTDDLLKMVIRTFQSSFPHTSLWQPHFSDVIIIGSFLPIEIDYATIKSKFLNNKIKTDLQRIQIPDAATFISLEMLTGKSVNLYSGYGGLNTEDNSSLEYKAPAAFFVNKSVTELLNYDERIKSNMVSIQIKKVFDNKQLSDTELFNIGSLHTIPNRGNINFGYSILNQLYQKKPKDKKTLEKLASTSERLRKLEASILFNKKLIELDSSNLSALSRYAWLTHINKRSASSSFAPLDIKESEYLFQKCIKYSTDTIDTYRIQLGHLFYDSQQYKNAMDQYVRALQIREKHNSDPSITTDALFLLVARSNLLINNKSMALNFAFQANRFNPSNQAVKDFIYEILMKR